MKTKERIVYSDILKTIAIFGVLTIHISSSGIMNKELMNFDLISSIFYGAIIRWSVPVFFMCSGIVFLNTSRDIKTKTIFTKYIPRLLIALIFWAAAYEAEPILSTFLETGIIDIGLIKTAIINLLTFNTHFHLYFLYIMILTYSLTPVIKTFLKKADKKDIEYLLVFWFIFAVLYPFLVSFYPFNRISGIVPQYGINLTYGLMGYYLLGHYLNTYNLKKRAEKMIFIFGIIGFFITFFGTVYMLNYKKLSYSIFLEGMSPNVLMMAVCVFLAVKKISIKITNEKVIKTFYITSKSSFCIYLTHDFFNIIFKKAGLFALNSAFIFIPLLSLLIFTLSFIVYLILSKIKYVNKYLI